MNTPLTITHLDNTYELRKFQLKMHFCYGCPTLPVEQDGSANKWDRGENGKDKDGLDKGEPDEEGEGSDEAADQKDHVDEQPGNKKPSGWENIGFLSFDE